MSNIKSAGELFAIVESRSWAIIPTLGGCWEIEADVPAGDGDYDAITLAKAPKLIDALQEAARDIPPTTTHLPVLYIRFNGTQYIVTECRDHKESAPIFASHFLDSAVQYAEGRASVSCALVHPLC